MPKRAGGENFLEESKEVLGEACEEKKLSYFSILSLTQNDFNVNQKGPMLLDNNAWRLTHTPLMYEIIRANVDGVRILLDAGADPYVENQKGKTSWDILDRLIKENPARKKKYIEIKKLLVESTGSLKRNHSEIEDEEDTDQDPIVARKIKIVSIDITPEQKITTSDETTAEKEDGQGREYSDAGSDEPNDYFWNAETSDSGVDAANDSLDADEEKIEEERSSENNPFLEKEVHLVELFEEYQDRFSAPTKEEDETPEDIESFEYADYKHLPMPDDMVPEIIDSSLTGMLPQVSGILAY